jgi:predicted component of type VI protein secretion system
MGNKKQTGGKCFLCPESAPAHPVLEEHHIVMQAAGGKELPTIRICANCHGNLHRQADNILARSIKNVDKKEFFAPAEMKRARPYIIAAMKSILATRETNMGETEVLVSIKIPREFRNTLHVLKTDMGYSNLDRLIKDILIRFAQSKGFNVTIF